MHDWKKRWRYLKTIVSTGQIASQNLSENENLVYITAIPHYTFQSDIKTGFHAFRVISLGNKKNAETFPLYY